MESRRLKLALSATKHNGAANQISPCIPDTPLQEQTCNR